jgi:hypothetical protein
MRKVLALAAALMVATVGQAQPPDLDDLLDKTADYVASYKHDFVGIVADETYRQEARGSRGSDLRGFPVEASRQKRDLTAENGSLRARIEVGYAPESSLGGLLVPSVMREQYDLKDGSVIEGCASYCRFRRYQVQTDEKIAPVKK